MDKSSKKFSPKPFKKESVSIKNGDVRVFTKRPQTNFYKLVRKIKTTQWKNEEKELRGRIYG